MIRNGQKVAFGAVGFTALVLCSVGSMPLDGQEQAVAIVFEPATPADSAAAEAYRHIWMTEGDRITRALEEMSGLQFEEDRIGAIIAEAPSSSGFRERPMRLRSSYSPETKRATLIHELGHRLQGRLFRREEEDHPYLFLYLYDTWVLLYGERFADAEVAVESQRRGLYDYETAWREVLRLTPAERKAQWSAFRDSRGP